MLCCEAISCYEHGGSCYVLWYVCENSSFTLNFEMLFNMHFRYAWLIIGFQYVVYAMTSKYIGWLHIYWLCFTSFFCFTYICLFLIFVLFHTCEFVYVHICHLPHLSVVPVSVHLRFLILNYTCRIINKIILKNQQQRPTIISNQHVINICMYNSFI